MTPTGGSGCSGPASARPRTNPQPASKADSLSLYKEQTPIVSEHRSASGSWFVQLILRTGAPVLQACRAASHAASGRGSVLVRWGHHVPTTSCPHHRLAWSCSDLGAGPRPAPWSLLGLAACNGVRSRPRRLAFRPETEAVLAAFRGLGLVNERALRVQRPSFPKGGDIGPSRRPKKSP